MYPQGYFHQRISSEGWQEESYERLNWADAPIDQATTPDGKPCITAVPLGDRSVLVAVWRVRLGRVQLYLLDTDLEENAPWDRELSARLYGGDRETRVQQEIVLGIGGVRVLKALGDQRLGLSPERGARRLRRAAADPRSHRDRLDLRRSARRDPPHDGVHDPHARGGGPRRVPVPPGREAPGRLLGHARPEPRSLPRARLTRLGRRRAVQHDGARAALGGRRERRQPAARRGDAGDVGADLAGRRGSGSPRRVGHQRRARADLDRRRSGGPVREVPRQPLARAARRPVALGRGPRHPRSRAVGRAPGAAALPLHLRPRTRAAAVDR